MAGGSLCGSSWLAVALVDCWCRKLGTVRIAGQSIPMLSLLQYLLCVYEADPPRPVGDTPPSSPRPSSLRPGCFTVNIGDVLMRWTDGERLF